MFFFPSLIPLNEDRWRRVSLQNKTKKFCRSVCFPFSSFWLFFHFFVNGQKTSKRCMTFAIYISRYMTMLTSKCIKKTSCWQKEIFCEYLFLKLMISVCSKKKRNSYFPSTLDIYIFYFFAESCLTMTL